MKGVANKFIHLFDITYLTIIYVTISIVLSMYLNKMIGPFDKDKANKKSTFRLIMEIYLNFSIIAIMAFLVRNMVNYIPFPLDDVCDFDHTTVHELNGGIIFGFVIFYYQKNLCDKINFLFNDRIFNDDDDKLDNKPRGEMKN